VAVVALPASDLEAEEASEEAAVADADKASWIAEGIEE
jgi:hypothetical protein